MNEMQMTPSKKWAYMVTIMAFIIVIISFFVESDNFGTACGAFSSIVLFAGGIIAHKQHQDTKKQVKNGQDIG